MANKDPKLRNIEIKAGVVKRIAKEGVYYQKEVEKEAAKVTKMEEQGADSHEVNKQKEVLGESEMMIPDCKRRLKASWAELNSLLEQEKETTSETETYKYALNILEENREAANQ